MNSSGQILITRRANSNNQFLKKKYKFEPCTQFLMFVPVSAVSAGFEWMGREGLRLSLVSYDVILSRGTANCQGGIYRCPNDTELLVNFL